MKAWGGIASLELSLAATFTRFTLQRPASTVESCVSKLAAWMSEAPARLAGLHARKGRIAVGFDADLVIWDPDAETTVDVSRLQQRHKMTPYAGRCLRGVVHTTLVRGQRVWDGGRLWPAASGRLL